MTLEQNLFQKLSTSRRIPKQALDSRSPPISGYQPESGGNTYSINALDNSFRNVVPVARFKNPNVPGTNVKTFMAATAATATQLPPEQFQYSNPRLGYLVEDISVNVSNKSRF